MIETGRLRRWLHQVLVAANRRSPLDWLAGLERDQWQSLAAYRGLVHQAFGSQPLAPQVCADYWQDGAFTNAKLQKAFFNPARRERENSSHHYGHDIQLKRHAGLPLIGPQLPWVLEHGLKVSRNASFESPKPWMRGYICMGPLRARWLRERYELPAVPIGPWITYARPVLEASAMARLRSQLGPILLVVLAHSWDKVERRMDLGACIEAVTQLARRGGYRRVIWLRHWKDPELEGLPADWIVACNGHRSNPWFLDSLRTLIELSDGLASNAFGTHLGYGVALGRRLHWIPVAVEQDLTCLWSDKSEEEALEWEERQRLSAVLVAALSLEPPQSQAAVQALLDPYWGFANVQSPEALRALLLKPQQHLT
jgi:hypothetical protein